jgi:hypothetical protein
MVVSTGNLSMGVTYLKIFSRNSNLLGLVTLHSLKLSHRQEFPNRHCQLFGLEGVDYRLCKLFGEAINRPIDHEAIK